MTEEDIKNNIILPFLKGLGFSEEKLSFEDSFTIKLGRGKHEIGKKKSSVHSDILVKENGKNLFIFEVKKSEHSLDEDDKDQAISYGRLVLPEICPYAVTTNGSDYKIYDVFDGTDLTDKGIKESKYVKNGYKIQLDAELESYAISKLITLSYDNLKNFCKNQIEDTLSRLRTENTTNLKKYIPAVYVNRQNITTKFHEFLASDKSCFIISGESGVGKTNTICNLVENSLENHPVFFYNAAELAITLDDSLARDFNWEFSSTKPIEKYVKQLDGILKTHKTELFVFVDAIDEWPRNNKEVELSDFVKRIYGKNIRLILSCKETRVNQFLSTSGIPSSLAQHSFENNPGNEIQVRLFKFDDKELQEGKRKYKDYFEFSNEITGTTASECKDPSLLRTLGEIYANKEVPSTLNSVSIYQKYLETKLEKNLKLQARSLQHLVEITKKMFDDKCDEIFETDLGSFDNESHEFCLDSGIIVRQTDDKGRNIIRFRSEGLRNYIIVYHNEKLDKLIPDKLEEFTKKHIIVPCGKNVITWYISKADSTNTNAVKTIIENNDKQKAIQFLKYYTTISENEFPFILKEPSDAKITLGLMVFYDDDNLRALSYGFRKTKKENELIWINKKDWDPLNKKENDLMIRYDVNTLHFSSRDFTNEDPKEIAYQRIFSTIQNRIKSRNLDESKNVGICIEKFLVILSKISVSLGLPENKEGFLNEILPLKIDSLLEALKPYTVYGDADFILRPYSLNKEDRISSEKLKQILQTISTTGNEIKSTLLPMGDTPRYPGWYHINSSEDYSKEGVLEYVKQFFRVFLDEYKLLVETNFPTIKEKLPLYQRLPIYVIGQLKKSSRSDKADGLMYAFLDHEGSENVVEIRDYDEPDVKITDDEKNWRFLFETKDGVKSTNEYSAGMVLDGIFRSYIGASIYTDCPITSWVYDALNSDLESLYDKKYKS